MNIIGIKDLENQGLSGQEIRLSRQIRYGNKLFNRTHDLPKKFKEKVLKICQNLAGDGIETFVSETNFAYTIWQAETASTSSQTNQLSLTKENSFSPKPDSLKVGTQGGSMPSAIASPTPELPRSQEERGSNPLGEISMATSAPAMEAAPMAEFQAGGRTSEGKIPLEPPKVKMYRGVEVSQPPAARVRAPGRKPKLYRGISYL